MKQEVEDAKFILRRFDKEEWILFLRGKLRLPNKISKVIKENQSELNTFIEEMINDHQIKKKDIRIVENNLFALISDLENIEDDGKISDFAMKMLKDIVQEKQNQTLKKTILYQYKTEIDAILFSAAAGVPGRLVTISANMLAKSNLPSDATIVVDEDDSGYYIRIESSIPFEYCMIFYRGEKELCRLKIDDQKPDEPVPEKLIKNFTSIKIFPYDDDR